MAGAESAEAWPPADISKNDFRTTVDQTAVLYDSAGVISHDENPDAALVVTELASQAKLWPTLSENQRFTLGLRESFVRIDVVEIEGKRQMAYRVVSPDLLIVTGHKDNPGIPMVVEEYRMRSIDGVSVWTRDILDISNPTKPAYRVERLGKKGGVKDVTRKVLGANPDGPGGKWSGTGYPYRFADGRPYIPGVLYHARIKWRTWDPWWGVELVETTLRSVAYWTFWGHNVMDASWPVPWALDVTPVGGMKTNPKTGRQILGIDTGSIVVFKSLGDKTGSLGNFPAGSDPKALGESIRAYSADGVAGYGINAADSQRTSADPRSGYAISLTRTTIREEQDKQIPIFTPFDEELLAKTAATWNRLGGMEGQLPESGYGIAYLGLPLTSEEKKTELDRWKEEAGQGVVSKVDLHMRLNRTSREEAKLALRILREEDAEFGAPGAPAPLI